MSNLDRKGAQRTALVTGAGGGIGRVIATRLARDGYNIVVNDLDPDSAKETAKEVEALGTLAMPIVADVGDGAGVRQLINSACEQFKCVDLLVNNAGISPIGLIADFSEKDWRDTFRINVDGVFFCCQAIVPRMLAQGHGNIINIASWNGKAGMPYFGPYCASKFAVIGLTQSLARETAPHIRVNAVCPGIVAGTMMRARADRDAKALGRPVSTERIGTIPLQRLAEPEDVASLVAFLASEESRYMTGQAINVTGGLWMH
jgi:NAD(P)-dependent dehydrogenase (short-subunit alcohol dehydrogenase family)